MDSQPKPLRLIHTFPKQSPRDIVIPLVQVGIGEKSRADGVSWMGTVSIEYMYCSSKGGGMERTAKLVLFVHIMTEALQRALCRGWKICVCAR